MCCPNTAALSPPPVLTCHSQSPCTASFQGTRPGHPAHSLTSASSVGHSRLECLEQNAQADSYGLSLPTADPCKPLHLTHPEPTPCAQSYGADPHLLLLSPFRIHMATRDPHTGQGGSPGPGRAGDWGRPGQHLLPPPYDQGPTCRAGLCMGDLGEHLFPQP